MYFLFFAGRAAKYKQSVTRNRMQEYKMNGKKLSKQTCSCLSNIGTRRTCTGADDSIISLLHKQHTFKRNPAKEKPIQ